jgi:type I restriction enzyme S subunit
MSFPRYPEYKNSGVEWLGEVPAHWEVWKISHAFGSIGSGTTPPTSEPEWYEDGGTPWITTGELREAEIYETAKTISERALLQFSSLRVHPAGSLAIAMYGATIGRLGILGVAAATNQACCVLSLPLHVDVRFMFYWFSAHKDSIISLYATGGGQPNINQETVSGLRVAAPKISEQSAIASFLDRETAKIDTLVAEQERLIELLKEKRQAVISHAVTKGLNPAAPMKDSGIEWLGEVPAHWNVKRLKFISPEITVGIVVEPSKYYCDEGVPTLRSLNVKPGKIVEENLVYISDEANDALKKSKLRSGDVVSVRSGQPGTTAVIPDRLDGCNCIDLIIIRKPHHGCERFLCWYLASDSAVYQFSEGSGGAIQQHFNIGTAANLMVSLPDPDEQRRIADYLNEQTAKFDALIADALRAIELLKEHRSALISAAVTGKIDVRGLVASEAA